MSQWNVAIAFDVGKRRTGVAMATSAIGVPLPLPTLNHQDNRELKRAVDQLIKAHRPDAVVIGLPLLPGGTEGEQAAYVRDVTAGWQLPVDCYIEYIDERFSTYSDNAPDPDAKAACTLLQVFIDKADKTI